MLLIHTSHDRTVVGKVHGDFLLPGPLLLVVVVSTIAVSLPPSQPLLDLPPRILLMLLLRRVSNNERLPTHPPLRHRLLNPEDDLDPAVRLLRQLLDLPHPHIRREREHVALVNSRVRPAVFVH